MAWRAASGRLHNASVALKYFEKATDLYRHVRYVTGAASAVPRWLSALLPVKGTRDTPLLLPPTYPRRPGSYRLGGLDVLDPYGWLTDYEQAAPYLSAEAKHYALATSSWAATSQQLLRELRDDAAAAAAVADPPESVGQYSYATQASAVGPDTIVRTCARTGKVAVLLSAEVAAADAAMLSHRLRRNVRGTQVLRLPCMRRIFSCCTAPCAALWCCCEAPACDGAAVTGDQLGAVKMSRDQGLMAYSLPLEGEEDRFCAVVRNVHTGALLLASSAHMPFSSTHRFPFLVLWAVLSAVTHTPPSAGQGSASVPTHVRVCICTARRPHPGRLCAARRGQF